MVLLAVTFICHHDKDPNFLPQLISYYTLLYKITKAGKKDHGCFNFGIRLICCQLLASMLKWSACWLSWSIGLKSPELQECTIFARYKINFISQNFSPLPHYSLVNRTILPKDCQRCISATLRKMWNKLMSLEALREKKKWKKIDHLWSIHNTKLAHHWQDCTTCTTLLMVILPY